MSLSLLNVRFRFDFAARGLKPLLCVLLIPQYCAANPVTYTSYFI